MTTRLPSTNIDSPQFSPITSMRSSASPVAAVDKSPVIVGTPLASPSLLVDKKVSKSSPRRRSPRVVLPHDVVIEEKREDIIVDKITEISESPEILDIDLPKELEIEQFPMPPEFSDYKGIVEHDVVEKELFSYGYIVEEKVIVTNSSGESYCKYILCCNKKGQKVLVSLVDHEGKIFVNPHDLMVKIDDDVTLVPYEIQVGVAECAGNEVCSIALDCASGICVLTKDPEKMEPVVSNMVFSESRPDRYGQMGNMPIPYPVIHIMEIKANPRQALEIQDRVTKDLRRQIIMLEKKAIQEVSLFVNNIPALVKKFQDESNRAIEGVEKSIDYLDRQLAGYMQHKDDKMPEEQRRMYRDVIYNMKVRNDWFVDIFKAMDLVAKTRARLVDANEKIIDLTVEMGKICSYADKYIADLK